ncbi:hypothetical protein AKJ16_DCAP13111 [Drosera capensis]
MTKDDDALPITSSSSSSTSSKKEIDGGAVSLLGKGRYKLWALGAIILLAFWSMFTGAVTLRWSAGNLNRIGDDDSLDSPLGDDLDVLEMEEREKVVRYMWDVYTNGRRIRLPKFWQEAFEAAYEDMTSDVPGVREAAITEITKMSIRSVELDPPPVQLTRSTAVEVVLQPIRHSLGVSYLTMAKDEIDYRLLYEIRMRYEVLVRAFSFHVCGWSRIESKACRDQEDSREFSRKQLMTPESTNLGRKSLNLGRLTLCPVPFGGQATGARFSSSSSENIFIYLCGVHHQFCCGLPLRHTNSFVITVLC